MARHLIPSDKTIRAIKPGDERQRLSDGKPNNMNGAGKREKEVQKVGFGNLRAEEHARSDLTPIPQDAP